MPFQEVYIPHEHTYSSKEKVTHEEYNNSFNTVRAVVNNAVAGIVETKQSIDTINESLDGFEVGLMPDESVTDNKLAPNSVKSSHINDDVFNKLSSLNYAQRINANIAHMLYNYSANADGAAYNNIYINKNPQIQAVTYSGSIRNCVQQNLSIIEGSSNVITGSASIQAGVKGPVITGISANAGTLYSKNFKLHVEYYQTYTPQEPFDNAKTIVLTPASETSGYKWNNPSDDLLSAGMYLAATNGSPSSLIIKGVKEGVETELYKNVSVSRLRNAITLDSTLLGALDYTSYKIYYTLNMYWDSSNYNYVIYLYNTSSTGAGWYHCTLSQYGNVMQSFQFSADPLELFSMDVVSVTADVFNSINSGPIAFDTPTKYVSVSYKANKMLKLSLYADGLTQALANQNGVEVEPGTYTHRFTLEQVTQNATVVFGTVDNTDISTANLTGYYVAG